MSDENNNDEQNSSKEQNLSFLTTMKSVVQSMLGVQSKENADRDFTKGKASHFIIAGLIVGALFVVGVATVVSMITSKLP